MGLFYNNPQPTQGEGNSNNDEMTGVKQNECERGGTEKATITVLYHMRKVVGTNE